MPGPLAGIRILEIAQVQAVPAAGTLLADMGADVIKVEPPWGDSTRYGRPLLPGEGRNYVGLNHGKRSMCLDLSQADARTVASKLVRTSDVVLLSLRSDQREAYGLTYEACRALRDDIIYAVNTAFGPNGPLGGLGGYNVNVTALSGIGASQGQMRDDQLIGGTGVAVSDAATALALVGAVSAALFYRLQTGVGQYIETSNLINALNCQLQSLNSFAIDDERDDAFRLELARLRADGAGFPAMQEARARILGRGEGGSIYFRFYRTRDDFISVGAISPHLASRFRAATGIDDPRQWPGFSVDNADHRAALQGLSKVAEDIFRTRTTSEWSEVLTAHRVPNARVNFVEEVLDDPQVVENGYSVALEHELLGTYRTVAPPVRMTATPVEIQRAAPALDAHTDELLIDLGYSNAEITRMRANGSVGRAAVLPEDYH